MRWWVVVVLCAACGDPEPVEMPRPRGPARHIGACDVTPELREEAARLTPWGVHVVIHGRVESVSPESDGFVVVQPSGCPDIGAVFEAKAGQRLGPAVPFRADCALHVEPGHEAFASFSWCRLVD